MAAEAIPKASVAQGEMILRRMARHLLEAAEMLASSTKILVAQEEGRTPDEGSTPDEATPPAIAPEPEDIATSEEERPLATATGIALTQPPVCDFETDDTEDVPRRRGKGLLDFD